MRRSSLFILVGLLVFGFLSCSDPRERSVHLAVQSLVAAPEKMVLRELSRVVAFGRYALIDIEQEMHEASSEGRLRLLDAIRKINEPEALPLVQLLLRYETDPEVKRQAGFVEQDLKRTAASRAR